MMVGRVFLVLTGACQFGHGVGGFTTNFIHSLLGFVSHQREVPKGTVVLRGVHDETYIAVAAYLRSLACK